MSCVFQNIDPPTPSPPSECVPPAFVAGGGHTRRVERGVGGSIFWKTQEQNTALYSTYIESSLLLQLDLRTYFIYRGTQTGIAATFLADMVDITNCATGVEIGFKYKKYKITGLLRFL
jgi:hypothetical protein